MSLYIRKKTAAPDVSTEFRIKDIDGCASFKTKFIPRKTKLRHSSYAGNHGVSMLKLLLFQQSLRVL